MIIRDLEATVLQHNRKVYYIERIGIKLLTLGRTPNWLLQDMKGPHYGRSVILSSCSGQVSTRGQNLFLHVALSCENIYSESVFLLPHLLPEVEVLAPLSIDSIHGRACTIISEHRPH